ncbi:MAG: glycoside hydrolase family 3 C-terminal domain-containing protein, partial [Clostridia bacterium]|nr:glycoside hydrolase family 3 C-terminal domain-containing protein [Clostridia bacterium]
YTLDNGKTALPLAKGSKVSLFGQGSVNFNYNSTGSSATGDSSGYPVLKDALGDFQVNTELWNAYSDSPSNYRREYGLVGGKGYYKVNEIPFSYAQKAQTSFATYGDAAIYVISRDSGEGKDITTVGSDGLDGSYLSITAEEQATLRALTQLKQGGTFQRIIVLLNSAVPVQLDFMFPDTSVGDGIEIDAALWVGNVGSTGIFAINDVLTGDVVPSGKLSDTYAKNNFSAPAMATWAANPDKSFVQTYSNAAAYSQFDKTQNTYAVYVEGIYVGYRYYETRYADKVNEQSGVGGYDYNQDVAFPFGYGLSYAEFYYDSFTVVEKDDKFVATVNILNASSYDAKDVVQIYMQKPYTAYDRANGVEKSAIELVGFTKVEIKSGDYVENVTVEIDKSVLRTYDANGKGTYILENGDYYFTMGANAHDAVNNVLVACGNSVENKSAAEANEFTYKYTVNSITEADGIDAITYAYSSVNSEVKIENRFSFAAINQYAGRGENSVTYVSRNNWEGTWPSSAVSLYITEQMVTDLTSDKPIPEDGSTMPVYGEINSELGELTLAMLRGKSFDDPLWESLLNQMSYAEQSKLITSAQHNTAVVASVSKPRTRDENGPKSVSGSSTGVSFPSEGIWASSFNRTLLRKVGDCLAEDALQAVNGEGKSDAVTGLYAPGVNLHRTPFGGRAHEYFSEDPFLMAICAAEEVQGMQAKGVLAYVKHFAVNDEETNRNGVCIWLNEQEMREIILLPFEYSFNPDFGNAHATMTSFNRIGCVWTSASSSLMEKVLRDEWGFDGFAVTDMASGNAQTFMTFYDGISNGTDCYDGAGGETELNAYRNSARFANKMRTATHRILYVIANYSASMNGKSTGDKFVPVMAWWQVAALAILIIFVALTAISATMLVIGYKKALNK